MSGDGMEIGDIPRANGGGTDSNTASRTRGPTLCAIAKTCPAAEKVYE